MIKCPQRPIRSVVAIGTLTAVVVPVCEVAGHTIGIRFMVKSDLFPDIRVGMAAQAVAFIMVSRSLLSVAGDTFSPTAVFIGRFLPGYSIRMAFDTLPGIMVGRSWRRHGYKRD